MAAIVYRSMQLDQDGLPAVGSSARQLGVRPMDIDNRKDSDRITPGVGGLSVSPDDPMGLPDHRRPAEFQGTGKDPVWFLSLSDLGTELTFRPDPDDPLRHGFIEPSREMSVAEYRFYLTVTRTHWKLAPLPGG